MNDCKVVFCTDRRGLPGLHVAAFSVLRNLEPNAEVLSIAVLSNSLTPEDKRLLENTLQKTNRRFALEFHGVDSDVVEKFPRLMGSTAAYFRLFAPEILEARRLLYLDIDILCDLDISQLWQLPMCEFPVAWVAEAPMTDACDRTAASATGNSSSDSYFNSGVMLIDVARWRTHDVTRRALNYLNTDSAPYHDQTALNVVLHRNSLPLNERFNCMSNMRRHWPRLVQPLGRIDAIVHFIDSPKPWDLFGELVHPCSALWRSVVRQTAIASYCSMVGQYSREALKLPGGLRGYRRSAKDRLLFLGYRSGLLKNVKGVSGVQHESDRDA